MRTVEGLRLHVRTELGYVDVGRATGDERLSTLAGLLGAGADGLEAAARVAPGASNGVADFAPAVPAPPKIFCLGRNYQEHADEMNKTTSAWPEVFVRFPCCLAGPFDDVYLPSFSSRADYEGELGVVIGARCRHVPAEQALEVVAGYVVLNDVSVRDWQHRGQQWTPGKNFEGTLPVGPELVTADELDQAALVIETHVNGELVQHARTSDMIVGVPELISFLSTFVTLEPGDLIATGTPSGVGTARDVFLDEGDVVEVTVEGIGTIRNRMRKDDRRPASDRWVRLAEEAVSR
ncbi:MAG: fumarylacetoacetate hydrolase family protein [Gaiella sp.]|nr:fumarylacetoacetate hydrolase family protein [Gaiella sp.]